VQAVLTEDHAMGTVYMPWMRELGAPYLLGLPDSPEYRRLRSALRAAMRPEDLPWIARMSRTAADGLLDAAGDRIDVVRGLTDPLIAEALERYVGIGRFTADDLDGARAAFRYVFVGRYSRRANRAAFAGAEALGARVGREIADRRAVLAAGGAGREDLLGRYLAAQAPGDDAGLRDADIRNTLVGVAGAWAANVARSTALAVDELLSRPGVLARARAAALREDEREVGAYVMEALRFRAPTPALQRRCTRTTTIGSRRVRLGHLVQPMIATAMMDPRRVECPRQFRTDRPPDAHLHFGDGLHRCSGEPLARVQIAAVVTALLRRGEPRRGGRLTWEGPFPKRLWVDL
jgi:cytochrome P450